jgi:glutamyl-tRNA synthetase
VKVRVRFAPSPTGYLHIGGARTCLFNWLYARARGGQFVLRIEDTDQQRSGKQYLDEISDSLSWLGLKWDEIYFQSQRFDIYKEYAEKLLQDKKAYVEKSPEKGDAIIFKVEPQTIKINDLIRGEIEFDATTIKDQVLIKSDGSPTYNFACVVDDAAMGITHVIRGDDHISNTPKQVLLYQALGLSAPEFAHLPLILGAEGGRLSKRTGATAVSDYRKMGYLPEALVNYLLLLSWAPGDNREVVDIKEAIELFDIKNVNKTAAVFDIKKLNWINSQYIKNQEPQRLTDTIIPLLIAKGHIRGDNFDRNYIVSLVKLFQGRISVLDEFAEWADFFFLDSISIDPEAQKKFLTGDLSREFKLFIGRLEALEKFDISAIEATFREMVKELNLEAKALIHPIRVAITGKTIGPGLFEVIYYLGKDRVKERLSRWIKK